MSWERVRVWGDANVPPASFESVVALRAAVPSEIEVTVDGNIVYLDGDGTPSAFDWLEQQPDLALGPWEFRGHWDGGVRTGRRDLTRFPNHETGDRLWALARAGDVQCVERDVTFVVDFPTVTAAGTFVSELDECFPDRSHHRVVEQTLDLTFVMRPEVDALMELQEDLVELAEEWGADSMGWEYVAVKKGSAAR